MNAKEMIELALKETGLEKQEMARRYGWSPQRLSGKLARNTLTVDEFVGMLEGIGVEVRLSSKSTGKTFVKENAGYGRRVRAMVDRVIYDTASSHVLANNFFADGVHEYNEGKARELYMDAEGRYFFAEYSEWEGAKDQITPVNAQVAAEFIEKYGTDIHNKVPRNVKD